MIGLLASAGVKKGVGKENLFLWRFASDSPEFGLNEAAFLEFGVEVVKLVDEDFVDLRALLARVEVLECLVDVPVVSGSGEYYLIMK